jgi:hypothetical protein
VRAPWRSQRSNLLCKNEELRPFAQAVVVHTCNLRREEEGEGRGRKKGTRRRGEERRGGWAGELRRGGEEKGLC